MFPFSHRRKHKLGLNTCQERPEKRPRGRPVRGADRLRKPCGSSLAASLADLCSDAGLKAGCPAIGAARIGGTKMQILFVEMMVWPPGIPMTQWGLPFFAMIVGVMRPQVTCRLSLWLCPRLPEG
jgi:hypothetical protein